MNCCYGRCHQIRARCLQKISLRKRLGKLSMSSQAKHLKGQLDSPAGNVTFFAPWWGFVCEMYPSRLLRWAPLAQSEPLRTPQNLPAWLYVSLPHNLARPSEVNSHQKYYCSWFDFSLFLVCIILDKVFVFDARGQVSLVRELPWSGGRAVASRSFDNVRWTCFIDVECGL